MGDAARAFSEVTTPVGTLRIEATPRGLAAVRFADRSSPAAGVRRDDEALAPFVESLREYFARERRDFDDVVLDVEEGTTFDRKVWAELRRIPYGETITYADLARRVGSPSGFRAVGHANGRNPVAIVVPCHRVVATGAGLGGYAGGLDAKSWLLTLEGRTRQATLGESATASFKTF